MLLLFRGWPRRIGLGLIALSLLAAVVTSARHDAGADAGACATASAWQATALAADHEVAGTMTAAYAAGADPYRTAVAGGLARLDELGPAPTIAAAWWTVYQGQYHARFDGMLAGVRAEAARGVDLTAVADAQRTPLAAWNAACR